MGASMADHHGGARNPLGLSHPPLALHPGWRECMGVEPTPRHAGDEATVLKTARTTGPYPLPRTSHPTAPHKGRVGPL